MKVCQRLLLILAVGCGGAKPAASPPPATPATVSCTDAVHKSLAGAPAPDPAFHASLVSLCETDRWSDDSKRCLVDSKGPDDGAKCEAMFTEAQRKNMMAALVQAANNATGEPVAPAQ